MTIESKPSTPTQEPTEKVSIDEYIEKIKDLKPKVSLKPKSKQKLGQTKSLPTALSQVIGKASKPLIQNCLVTRRFQKMMQWIKFYG